MRRLAFALATASFVIATGASAHASGNHPWCMVIQDLGDGWACGFDTFEQCREEARPGNTGFCTSNPAYQAPTKPVRAAKHRKHA